MKRFSLANFKKHAYYNTMTVVPFDTLKLADRLQAGGFTHEQARAAASALAEVMGESDLVTNRHLDGKLLETRAALETKISDAKTETLKFILGTATLNILAVLAGMFGLAKLLGH